MLNAKCAHCQVAMFPGAHHPYMTADISYQQIVNGGFVNTLIPKESILYKMINGEMNNIFHLLPTGKKL